MSLFAKSPGHDLASTQPPVFLPSGQPTVAELERNRGSDGIGPNNHRLPISEVNLGAVVSGIVEERNAERGSRFRNGHAESEWDGVGLIPAIRRPANPKR